MTNNDSLNDLGDEDLRLLFLRSRPQETSVDVDRIFTTSAAISEFPLSTNSRRKWKMTFRTAVVLTVAASLVLLLNFPHPSTESIGFAQVKAQVEQVRTVDFIETSMSLSDPPEGAIDTRFGNETPRSALKKQIAALESRLKTPDEVERTDIQFRLGLLKPYLQAEEKQIPEIIRRIRIKGKHLQRTDDLFPFRDSHGIRNAQTNETVTFDHANKTKILLTTQVVINRKTGEKKEHPNTISPAAVFFQRFRAVPAEATQRLPVQQIDGQDAIGFRSVEKHDDGTWTRTYWIHPESKLPIQIVTEFESQEEGLGSSRWVQDHFVFDADLDETLFSTKTPAGYTSKEEKIYGFE